MESGIGETDFERLEVVNTTNGERGYVNSFAWKATKPTEHILVSSFPSVRCGGQFVLRSNLLTVEEAAKVYVEVEDKTGMTGLARNKGHVNLKEWSSCSHEVWVSRASDGIVGKYVRRFYLDRVAGVLPVENKSPLVDVPVGTETVKIVLYTTDRSITAVAGQRFFESFEEADLHRLEGDSIYRADLTLVAGPK
jgi:hypothetical protein